MGLHRRGKVHCGLILELREVKMCREEGQMPLLCPLAQHLNVLPVQVSDQSLGIQRVRKLKVAIANAREDCDALKLAESAGIAGNKCLIILVSISEVSHKELFALFADYLLERLALCPENHLSKLINLKLTASAWATFLFIFLASRAS